MSWLVHFIALLAIWGLVLPQPALAQGVPVLSSDLTLQFDCSHRQRDDLEFATEEFLTKHKFKVLNQGRTTRQHGTTPFYIRILGLDNQERIVSLVALQGEARLALTLNTPPPTQRASALEQAIEHFVTHSLGCEIRQVSRGENPAGAKVLHSNEVARIRELFRQEEILKGRHSS